MRTGTDSIRTARLLLRRPQRGDLAAVCAIHGDPRTNLYNPNGPTSDEECRGLLDDWDAHWSTHGFGYWAAELADAPGKVIGFGGIRSAPEFGPGIANLYFRLSPDVWGRGIALELGRAAIRLAFEKLNFDRVIGSVRRNNEPSRKALARLGMSLQSEKPNGPSEGPSLIYELKRR